MIPRRTAFIQLIGVIAALALVQAGQQHAAPHWSYSGATGPAHWGDLDTTFATCKIGRLQSPIDIRSPKPADLPPIQFAYRPAPLHIINNGHTIQINYAPGSAITVAGRRYDLKQFHFHHPSEETIDGKGFAMVAHLVHAASDGSLAVVALLLDAKGAANPVIARSWQHLPAKEGPEQALDSVQIDAAGLLPADRGYYTFAGSLTTPPCTENVKWFVLKTPVTISPAQSDTFGRLYANVARPTQPLNGREVLMTK